MKAQRLSSRGIVGLVAAFLSLFLMALPAIADSSVGGDSSDQAATATTVPVTSVDHDGDADSDPSTAYTEDNDTVDGGAVVPNNVPDEGDNAHPSGKDRSVENGGSGNQGNSESTPDQNGKGPERDYEGTDKPNGAGGVDKADQDGNNGCGNDDDFEDDNEGWCGHKPKKTRQTPPTCPDGSHMPANGKCDENEDADTCPDGSDMPANGKCDENEDADTCPDGSDMPANGKCDEGEEHGSVKVTICHATGSSTNPFVEISPSAAGVFHGHIEHQDAEDIIPPFEYQGTTYSQNWDEAGQAIYAAHCVVEDEVIETPPTTTTIPVENPPTESCPEGTMENESGECVTPPVDCPEGTTMNDKGECVPDEVLGEVINRGGMSGKSPKADKVLKKIINKPEARKPLVAKAVETAGATLPFTGSNVLMLLSLALGLLALGLLSLESTVWIHNASVRKARS